MKNWSIRQRILGSFALVLALMFLMGGIVYTQLAGIKEKTEKVERDSLPGVYYSGRIARTLILDFALTAEHILEVDAAKRRPIASKFEANRTEMETHIQDYERSIFTAKDREMFDAFNIQLVEYKAIQQEVFKSSVSDPHGKGARELLTANLIPKFAQTRSAIYEITDYNKKNAEQDMEHILLTIKKANTGLFASFGIALLFTIVCGYILLRAINQPLQQLVGIVDVIGTGDFTRRIKLNRRDEFGSLADGFNRMTDELTTLVSQVQKSGTQVNTSVNEVAATTKEQQATATEIAATTTEIGATSREISATSRELVKTMSEVSAVAEQSAILAGNGQEGLTHMEETMRQVMEAAGSINAKLAVLNEKASNINQVVTTITKVADQTNLLSLNAAIEAEKAGEYGKGFSVVATEIRSLADQTAVATYDIEQMVKEIQSAVSAGVMGMDKFSEEVRRGMQEVQQVGGQLSQIIQQVQALAPRFEAVSEGMQAQATGAEQITQALTQLSEAVQQTVESLRQSGQAIDGLNEVSSTLRNGVARFKLAAAL
jgi:methyl-accepting chemotaxis protein WspA